MFSIIFDMDGTLLDTQQIVIPAWERAGNIQGFKGAGDLIKYVCGMSEPGWSQFLIDHFPDVDLEKFKEDTRKYVSENLIIRYMPGAELLIDFLKQNNIKMAVASGTRRETVERYLKEVGCFDDMSAIIGGRDIKNGKPAPDIFLLAAQKLGVPPQECIVFEDSPNGIRAAHAAGMRSIGIPDIALFSDEVKALEFAEITSLDKAIDILKELL